MEEASTTSNDFSGRRNHIHLFQKLDEERDQSAREQFRQAVSSGSVAAWKYINLLGSLIFQRSGCRIQLALTYRPFVPYKHHKRRGNGMSLTLIFSTL